MRVLVFLGTKRDSSPPRPARLGTRVALACERQLTHAGLEVVVVDPLDFELPQPFKPHFAYAKGRAPEALQALANQIELADAYVMVSPEYNHSMSPALADLLNHFGASLFAYKPSAIVTYSAGQWGGVRAAVNMRTFLSELGCLPVSAMVHVPKATEVFDESGRFVEGVDATRWISYLDRTISQLLWWANVAKSGRDEGLPTEAFARDPSQRNAP